MAHHQNPADIEAEIERDRASLASTIDELQDRVSVEHMAREAMETMRANAASYSRAIDEAVRANPMAVALTAAGIAWLVFGGRKANGSAGEETTDERWHSTAGEIYGRRPAEDLYGRGASDEDWAREADSMRARASSSLNRIESDARDHYRGMRAGIADRAAGARDFAAERAAVMSEFADGLRKSFSHKLDDLSEGARERVIAARERAYAARIRASRMARDGGRGMARTIEEHPMVAGAVALAVGAALGAALPRTQTEDRAFGDRSDRLMDEAAHMLRQERERARRVAAGVGDELKTGLKETVEAASEKASETGERVRDRAEAEASKSANGRSGTKSGGDKPGAAGSAQG